MIAEISSNHNRDLDRAKKMISLASRYGFDAVKFQVFKINKLFAEEILSKSKQHSDRRQWELPLEFIPHLAEYSRTKGVKFGCTPFYIEAVDFLNPYVDFFKVSSYEILWHDLIRACSDTGKPFFFSTGMASFSEVRDVINVIAHSKTSQIFVMKCTSQYPSELENVNLASIKQLKKLKEISRKEINIGLSDHSRSIGVVLRAIHKYKVAAVELHIDLDEKGVEFSTGHCWLPGELALLKQLIDEGILSDGRNKVGAVKEEFEEREWRADPNDGLRPSIKIRKNFHGS